MRALINDAIRFIIGRTILLFAPVLNGRQSIRIFSFNANQRRLKLKYRHAAARCNTDARFAMTSGSTGEPKKILYTRRRLRSFKFIFSAMFIRACGAYRLRRTSLYVFSSFQQDASLTSLLLDEHKLPPYFSTLQAPYRVQQHPAIRKLAAEYGAAAVRLWLLALANPGVLYATNPSTISAFLDELEIDWLKCSRLVKTWCDAPQRFDPAIQRIASRLDSRGSTQRLRSIASSNAPVPLQQFAPSVSAYICWTGGYVQPFLDRLAVHLPATRYRSIPMYSMSTETIETETVFRDGETFFLPLARGVVYEFVDDDENLLTPDRLTPGKSYALVVSDQYGLRRYQTEDLFHCRRTLNGLPDLIFLRRRGLEYSFTGEKVTAEQLTIVFGQLRSLLSDGFLTCVPSSSPIPHYKFVVIRETPITSPQLLATLSDNLLADLNHEYKSKRVNGTLGPIMFVQTTAADFANRFADNWETQFKFLPLYRRTWESTMSSFKSSPVS
ncbi:MAG TPA: GH3 auxin-responsive promoter family protein [Pyrinomonadaceae bacterium]|nr:GH3 auxin-responsive promoter family protein [Pyrinomonadaceae bacterium]